MEPRLRNVNGEPRRWNIGGMGNNIVTFGTQVWKAAAVLVSDILFPKTGLQGNTSWIQRPYILLKAIMGVIALILTCAGVWAAVSALLEAKTTTQLAQWTSAKDFLEFCESHNTTSCMTVRNMTLPPPPGFSLSKWRRALSVVLWRPNTTTTDNYQKPSLNIILIVTVVSVSVCLAAIMRISSKRKTCNRLITSARLALRQLSKTKLWPGIHSAGLPTARQMLNDDNDVAESSDFATYEVVPRHRKPAARRRREARQDRFSRYRTTENSTAAANDDTSSDELYTHGGDTRRARLRLRRRMKRVANDENV